jgi:hypothetical protein
MLSSSLHHLQGGGTTMAQNRSARQGRALATLRKRANSALTRAGKALRSGGKRAGGIFHGARQKAGPALQGAGKQVRPALRSRILYSGLAVGVVLGILFALVGNAIAGSRNANAAGNDVVTLSDSLLTLAVRPALQGVRWRMPLAPQQVAVTAQDGDVVALDASGPGLLGANVSLHATFQPTVTKGSLHMPITALSVSGTAMTLKSGLANLLQQTLETQVAALLHGHIPAGLRYQVVAAHTQAGALMVTANVTASK